MIDPTFQRAKKELKRLTKPLDALLSVALVGYLREEALRFKKFNRSLSTFKCLKDAIHYLRRNDGLSENEWNVLRRFLEQDHMALFPEDPKTAVDQFLKAFYALARAKNLVRKNPHTYAGFSSVARSVRRMWHFLTLDDRKLAKERIETWGEIELLETEIENYYDDPPRSTD